MLQHDMCMWPKMIISEFWTFALSHAKTIHNMTSRRGRTKCLHKEFADELPSLRPPDFHTFGCRSDQRDAGQQTNWKMFEGKK